MDNLETIKQELLLQKTAIEKIGGTVEVKNSNPSPSEITAGIGTIDCPELALATATENDVLSGKTFYATDSTLKTGTLVTELTDAMTIRLYDYTQEDDGSVFSFAPPEGVKDIHSYILYNFPYQGSFSFNSDLTKISEYAFYATKLDFPNFQDLTNLEQIGNYAFYNISGDLDINILPTSLVKINEGAFMNAINTENVSSITLPPNLTSLGSYAFASNSSIDLDFFDFNTYTLTSVASYLLMYLRFDCDLELPESVTTISRGFNYRGRFNNVIIPSGIKTINEYAFGASTSESASSYTTKSFTILAETPPTCYSTSFNPHYKNDTFEGIFVPDESVEEYQASSYFSTYVDYIKPLSERSF